MRRVRLARMKPFRMYKVPGGHLFPFERLREAATPIVRRWTSLQLLLDKPDVHLDAQHVRVHLGRGGTTERFVPLLELEVNLAHARKRAEVTRIALSTSWQSAIDLSNSPAR